MDGLFNAFLAHAETLQVIVHCKYTLYLVVGVTIFQEYALIPRFADRSLYWSLLGINWLLASSYNTSSMCGASYLQTD